MRLYRPANHYSSTFQHCGPNRIWEKHRKIISFLSISLTKFEQQFINSVAGRSVAKVGNDMDPCTTDIQPLVVPYPADLDRRIVLVDTPGFNIDDNVDEVEILKRVAVWLGDT